LLPSVDRDAKNIEVRLKVKLAPAGNDGDPNWCLWSAFRPADSFIVGSQETMDISLSSFTARRPKLSEISSFNRRLICLTMLHACFFHFGWWKMF
jgi:hypothetical protein